jgi:hypothetical protein
LEEKDAVQKDAKVAAAVKVGEILQNVWQNAEMMR